MRNAWSRYVRLGSATAALLLGVVNATPAAGGLETKIQAAYLFNFTRFVEWPSLPDEAITICVVGDEAVGGMLADLSGRQAKGRPLKVEQGSPADPGRCQILYISQSDHRLGDLLAKVKGEHVLTVSDAANFTRHGGVIGFYAEGGKLKLEINQDKAKAANLKISSKLLEIARLTP